MGNLANAEMALPGQFRLLCLLAMLVTTTGNEIFASIYAGINGFDGDAISCASPNPNLASFKHTLDQCIRVSLSAETHFYVKTSLMGSSGGIYSTTFSENDQCTASNAAIGTSDAMPVSARIDTCNAAAFTIGGLYAYKAMFSDACASDALKTLDCTSGVCVDAVGAPGEAPTTDAPTTEATLADCPDDNHVVDTEAECAKAAADLEEEAAEAVEDDENWPKGCYISTAYNTRQVFFNTHATGARNDEGTPICVPDFVRGTFQGCPYNYPMISMYEESDCQRVAG